MNRVIAELAKTFGKALVTGLGVEVARRVSNRFAPAKAREPEEERTDSADALRRENEALREELAKLRRDAGGQP
jgi:hypothetical protein